MESLSLLVKPVSGACNLDCAYCFYKDVWRGRSESPSGVMSHKLLEQLKQRIIESCAKKVQIAFQGGEPLLAGTAFFECFEEIASELAERGVSIQRSIQTNGTRIDEQWTAFFKRHQYLVGISIDGTNEIHDLFRRDYQGCGSYKKVMSGIRLLQEASVPVNALTVVSEPMCSQADAVYKTLKDAGFRYMQFIPCLNSKTGEKNAASPTAEQLGRFLSELFDLWYADYKSGRYVSIRAFDDYIHLLSGKRPSSCAAGGRCGEYIVLESDGRCYPCDFFTTDADCLGSIENQEIKGIRNGNALKEFGVNKFANEECSVCLFSPACRGGCKKDYYFTGMEGKNRYCDAYKAFFLHTYPRLLEIAAIEKKTTER